jgi:acetate kinase
MSTLPILVMNSGSSSIKFSVHQVSGDEQRKLLEGEIEGIGSHSPRSSRFWIKSWVADGDDGKKIVDEQADVPDLNAAYERIATAIRQPPFPKPAAVGHRMVNGGPTVIENQLLTPVLIEEMERYTAFAPLHSPAEIYIMRQVMQLFPDVPNFVCLDSWFHRMLPEVARSLPIPEEYSAMGVRRFGAHGLSYESIVAHLEPHVPARMIVAHLGNGASVAAIRDGHCVDTSMGLTPTGGIISGSRTGDLDPGALIFMLRKLDEKASSKEEAAELLEKLVNRQSGLKGVSGLTNDMRELRAAIGKGNEQARLAVSQFTYVLRKFIGSYIAVLGGLDALVFTGGIGENDADTRAEVCAGLDSLGISIDAERNRKLEKLNGAAILSADGARVRVMVIPAAEDLTIVKHVCRLLKQSASDPR